MMVALQLLDLFLLGMLVGSWITKAVAKRRPSAETHIGRELIRSVDGLQNNMRMSGMTFASRGILIVKGKAYEVTATPIMPPSPATVDEPKIKAGEGS